MLPPTGDQFEIEGGGYRAVVTECGAGLRVLEHAGRPLVDGFAEDAMPSAGSGQLLMPWPNRIRDGAYSFGGRDHQLPLSEPARHNASHGLVRWAAWTVEEHTPQLGVAGLPADGAERLPVDARPARALRPVGRRADRHPDRDQHVGVGGAVRPGCAPLPRRRGRTGSTGWSSCCPPSTRLLVDDRMLPIGREPVEGTPYDFRVPRPIRDTALDDAFTDLDRDDRRAWRRSSCATRPPVGAWRCGSTGGTAGCRSTAPTTGPGAAHRSLAVEPMTAPADAFRSGDDLVTLAPAGEPGDELSASWGIRALV